MLLCPQRNRKEAAGEQDIAAERFLLLVEEMRIVLLQDLAVLRDMFPDWHGWKQPAYQAIFRRAEWQG